VNLNRLLGCVVIAAALVPPSASRLRAQTQRGVAALPPAWVLPPAAQPPAPQVVAVRAGRLFDPRSGTTLTNQVIVVRGDRIVDVGASAAIPAGARIVDLSRVTVLPGLIDTHLHTMTGSPLTAPGGPGIGPGGAGPGGFAQPLPYHALLALVNAQRDLNAGFTTIVDLMSHGGWYGTVDLRNAINNGLVQGPRMQVAGPGLINASPTAARIPLLDREPISALGQRWPQKPSAGRLTSARWKRASSPTWWLSPGIHSLISRRCPASSSS
jgi:hypothetical protein